VQHFEIRPTGGCGAGICRMICMLFMNWS